MIVIREFLDRMKHGDFHKARDEAKQITDLDALTQIKAILDATKPETAERTGGVCMMFAREGPPKPVVDPSFPVTRVSAEQSRTTDDIRIVRC